MSVDQPVIFLGAAHRALHRGHMWDIVGMTDVLMASFFPVQLNRYVLTFAIRSDVIPKGCRITICNDKLPQEQAWIDFLSPPDSKDETAELQIAMPLQIQVMQGEVPLLESFRCFVPDFQGIPYHFVAIPCPELQLFEPGRIVVKVTGNDDTVKVGGFDCYFLEPAQLSVEEVRAIQSRPTSFRAIQFVLECKQCGDRLSVVARLDPTDHSTIVEGIDICDAPDTWQCKCGANKRPLQYLKKSIHELFRRGGRKDEPLNLNANPLYERGAIEAIMQGYEKLILTQPAEEAVQLFLEAHPILWGFLAPIKIFHKPAVLTKRRADFGILSASRILYLVEIEKPQTKIAKRDGGRHSEFQAGLDQIADWKVTVGNQRSAFLGELGIQPDQVHHIRYILVAGLSTLTSPENMVKVRQNQPPDTQIYCFDELTSFLRLLQSDLAAL